MIYKLIYLHRLHVPIGQHSLWPPLPDVLAARPPGSIPPTDASGSIDINCHGGLRFDFATYTLSIRDRVSIEHRGAGLPIDKIRCRNLDIELDDPFGTSVQTHKPKQMLAQNQSLRRRLADRITHAHVERGR